MQIKVVQEFDINAPTSKSSRFTLPELQLDGRIQVAD